MITLSPAFSDDEFNSIFDCQYPGIKKRSNEHVSTNDDNGNQINFKEDANAIVHKKLKSTFDEFTSSNTADTQSISSESSNGTEREQKSNLPSMSKEEATEMLSKLIVVKKPKGKTLYMRFKTLLIKDAKQSGDKETLNNITNIANMSWQKVKGMNEAEGTRSSVRRYGINDVSYLLHVKADVAAEKKQEDAEYTKAYDDCCENFYIAATALLLHEAIGTSTTTRFASLNQHHIQLSACIKRVTARGDTITGSGCELASETETAIGFSVALGKARAKLHQLEQELSIHKLVEELRNAPIDMLIKHSQKHHELLSQLHQLKEDEIKNRAIENAQAEAQAEREREELSIALKNACSFKNRVLRGLKIQMKYDGPSLKNNWKRIRYTEDGVSPLLFAKAFGIEVGMKCCVVASWEVGSKPLRYSGMLKCIDVEVKLLGENVIATTKYGVA